MRRNRFLSLLSSSAPVVLFMTLFYSSMWLMASCDDSNGGGADNNVSNNQNNTSASNNQNNQNNTSTSNNTTATNNINNNTMTGEIGIIELGEFTPVAEGSVGRTDTITFTLPEDTLSFVVVVRGADGVMYEVKPIQTPDEFLLNGGTGCAEMGFSGPNRTTPMESVGTALAPNTDDAEVRPHLTGGEYAMRIEATVASGFSSAADTNPVEVDVVVRRGEAIPEYGKIDLNLWFTGINGITAENAADATPIQNAIEEMRTIYSAVNIRIDQINYFDADEAFSDLGSIQGAGSEYAQMLASSEGAPEAINLFMVSHIESPMGGGGTILGVSGGIPGPYLFQGTWRSGIAVVQDPSEIGASPGMVWAHEVGHFLGLYHTTEMFAEWGVSCAHDPIEDTPINDTTLLMYYSGSGNTLSEQQGVVMRGNPMVKRDENPGTKSLPPVPTLDNTMTLLMAVLADYDQTPTKQLLDHLGGFKALKAAAQDSSLNTYRRMRAISFMELYPSAQLFEDLSYWAASNALPLPLRRVAINTMAFTFKANPLRVMAELGQYATACETLRQATYRALLHLNTPAAHEALQGHLKNEPAPRLRRIYTTKLIRTRQ